MFFKFQNFSNFADTRRLAIPYKPLIGLGGVLVVLGLLITAYPEFFAAFVAFVLYLLASICFYFAWKLWNLSRKMNPYRDLEPEDDFEQNDSSSVKVDVTVIK